jgi:hypothetical protein
MKVLLWTFLFFSLPENLGPRVNIKVLALYAVISLGWL